MTAYRIPLHLDGLEIQDVFEAPHEVLLELASGTDAHSCPCCGVASRRIHSRYQRWLDDLPCFDRVVRIQLIVRRFFCDDNNCSRRIFAEQFPSITAPYSRRTSRLEQALRGIAFSAGSLPGSRLATRLHMPTSASTLLRLLRARLPSNNPTPRVLGVDDWALRKGQSYGTILVDLERRQVIDLLEGREAEALTKWLKAHPGVEIISRDRSATYAKGAREGAPDAIQVADRWHVLKNLAEATEAFLKKHVPLLQRIHHAFQERDETPTVARPPATAPSPTLSTSQENRRIRYERARELHQQGHSQAEISRAMGLDRRTVRSYIRGPFPAGLRPSRRRALDPYRGHLQRRWEVEGCQNTAQLWQELRDQGFRGSLRSVQRYVVNWRARPARSSGSATVGAGSTARSQFRRVSPRRATWWLLAREKPLTDEEQWMRERLLEEPAIAQVGHLGRAFQRMIRDKDVAALEGWMKSASAVDALKSFVNGLKRDLDAVQQAITSEWSQGQAEGQVNRLKTLKRQMYGRASFSLLRGRVLEASAEQQELAAAKRDRQRRRSTARQAA